VLRHLVRAWLIASLCLVESACRDIGTKGAALMNAYRRQSGGVAGSWRRRGLNLALAAFLATTAVGSVPATTLAAGSYPLTGVTVKYYPMYYQDTSVDGAIVAVGCVLVIGVPVAGLVMAAACGGATWIMAGQSGKMAGYWRDYVVQTSQVIAHYGGPCDNNKSNCSGTWRYDVYGKSGSAAYDSGSYWTLGFYGPAAYGWSSVGACVRLPWVSSWQLSMIIAGYGI
jgi:hypothetical protein